MPVADHEVHDKVKHDKQTAGCFNRTGMKSGYWAKDGYYANQQFANQQPTITQKVVFIPHTMSTKCRQDMNLQECEGCTAEKDEKYLDESGKWK